MYKRQAFVREQLFTKVLPKTEVDVPRSNAILDEHNDWLSAISEGTQLTITVQQGAQAVGIAKQVIDSIGQNSWNQTPAAGLQVFDGVAAELPAVEKLFEDIAKAA